MKNKFLTAIYVLFVIWGMISCAKTSREDLLQGQFGTVDKIPPQIISPKSESKITPDANGQMKTTLTWGSKIGALRYILEIALDNNFSQHIAGSPIEIKGKGDTPPENSYVFTPPDSLTYYWRVRANITEEGKYSETAVFHAMDAVYVHCPASVTTCSEDTDNDGINDTIGNKSKPYRRIETAINESVVLQIDARIARRDVSNTAYNESVNLIDGAKIYGAYDSTAWIRDTQINQRTKVESAEPQVVYASVIKNQNTILDGFDLKQKGNIGSRYVIYAQNNNANLIIQNNTLTEGGTGGNSAYGIYNNYSSPNIKNNIIHGGTGGYNYLIYNSNSSPNISFNTIKCFSNNTVIESCNCIKNFTGSSPIIYMNTMTGGYASGFVGSTYGIDVSNSAPIIIKNTIDAGSGSVRSGGIQINFSDPFIALNTIYGGNSAIAQGFYSSGYSVINSFTYIIGNTIDSGIGTKSYGIYNWGTMTAYKPYIDGNIIRTSGSGNRYVIYEGSAASDPFSVQNNVIFDAGSGGASFLYADYKGVGLGTCSTLIPPGTNDWNCITDSDNTTNPIEWSLAPDAPTTNSGNLTLTGAPLQTIADMFFSSPFQIVYTSDTLSDANSTYDGSSTTLEVADSATCNLFKSGQYFEYFYDKSVYTITAADCVTNQKITFTPALPFDFGRGVPILLWNTVNTNYDKKYALKYSLITPSPALNAGPACPTGYSTQIHIWGAGASQTDCDDKFPFARSTYVAANAQCRTTFLYPATEIMSDSLGNENGLCEAGETCLMNPNIGAYAGHPSTSSGTGLVNAGCDVSLLPAPFTNNVTLLKYEMNGY